MSSNYYENLLEKINLLVKNDQKDEAIQLIEEELKLPYIPAVYEKPLLEIYNQIKQLPKKSPQLFDQDEIVDIFLKHSSQHSNDFLYEIAQMMNSYNWNGYFQELQEIFRMTEIANNVKAAIYNILSIQNVNHLFWINDAHLNPCKNLTTFETEFATKNFDKLSSQYFDEPIIGEIAKKSLMLYLLNFFPKSMFLVYEDITNDLILIAKVMLSQVSENKLNKKQLSIYQKIKNS